MPRADGTPRDGYEYWECPRPACPTWFGVPASVEMLEVKCVGGGPHAHAKINMRRMHAYESQSETVNS